MTLLSLRTIWTSTICMSYQRHGHASKRKRKEGRRQRTFWERNTLRKPPVEFEGIYRKKKEERKVLARVCTGWKRKKGGILMDEDMNKKSHLNWRP